MSSNKLKLGIFGFGCVGQGLYKTLHETNGIKADIVKICVKDKAKFRPFPSQDLFTFEKREILDNEAIDVVVELIDDAAAAYDIVTQALKKGKAVVTANKKLIAEHLKELLELSREYDSPLLYEAACCASIPIIRNLEEYYDNDLLSSISGIFNGSTNYILTKVIDEQLNYEDALSLAQDNGFAETNPALDVKGLDARYKLSIIISHAFGLFVQPEDVWCVGIDQISAEDIKYAQEKGLAIKLVATAKRIGDKILALVAPQFIDKTAALAAVNNEYNAVEITGAFSEKQLFIGKGAGGYPTGAAVLSDISALTYQYKYEYKKSTQQAELSLAKDFLVEVYVGFEHKTDIHFSDFEHISESYVGNNHSYLIGKISIKNLKKAHWADNTSISVLLFGDIEVGKVEHFRTTLVESAV